MGYSKSEASLVLSKIIQENPDSPNTEVLIRLSLQKLAQKVKIMTEIRLIDGHSHEGRPRPSLRPETLADFYRASWRSKQSQCLYSGSEKSQRSTRPCSFIWSAGTRKTTLAQIIAKEMNVGFRSTSGPVITKSGDLAALLTNLQRHDILLLMKFTA